VRGRARVIVIAACAAVALFAAGCTPNLVPPSGAAPLRYRDAIFDTVTTTSNVTFGTADNLAGDPVTLKLDVYAPQGDTVTQRPAIVWVHGGSFSSGDKTSPELVDEATTFAKKGYVNFSINYRLEPGGCSASAPSGNCLKAILESRADAQTAVRWIRANASTYGVDTSRIAIGGTSAGAITALNAGYSSNDAGTPADANVRAAVSFSGAHLFGTITANDPPALLFHGTADPLVPYTWAKNTVADATAAGAAAYLTAWEGDGHVPYVKHRDEILSQTTNFLYHTLGCATAAR
jgi:acetyl esterase/lipase